MSGSPLVESSSCRVGVAKGDELLAYSFPPPHPFNSSRVVRFWEELARLKLGEVVVNPEKADDQVIELFHSKEHVEFVRKASALGYGALDQGDTPAFKGVMDAAAFAVGSTLACVGQILDGRLDHGFNPVGGLHHARPNRSAGFCVFNDIGVAIEFLRRRGMRRVLYVDIDVHHGDGVFYPYEDDPEVFIFDIHEDGTYIYPGTGSSSERGEGKAAGTKFNVPLLPGEGDERVREILPRLEEFAFEAKPEFIILQCGADGLAGDPLGGLTYSDYVHSNVTRILHKVSHQVSKGRLVALGGGGYSPENCALAWTSVVKRLRENAENANG
ncbi:MAG: acetoin utilization protein AcuC [Thaumarchaeota archaeon]|nr:acetoin utilization protein AcuC [Nitrososphaerota archaeon]